VSARIKKKNRSPARGPEPVWDQDPLAPEAPAAGRRGPARKPERERDEMEWTLRNIAARPEGGAQPRARRSPLSRILGLIRWVLQAALALACIAVFYVAVIMGETPEVLQSEAQRPAATAAPKPAALPGGARSFESADLAQLEALLPARLATLPARQGFRLESGKAEDLRIAGVPGLIRAVTLTYQHPALRTKVILHSATPGGYIRRFEQSAFTLEPAPVTMGTLQAMSLTAEDRHFYVATLGDAVYIVEGLASVPELASVPGWVMLPPEGGEQDAPTPAPDTV
jgi:hypothetical protein